MNSTSMSIMASITNASSNNLISVFNTSSQTVQENQSNNGGENLQRNEYSIFFDFVVPGILLNVIGLLGLIGNTLSIIVLSRPQMRQSINCILIGLASFDSILLVTSILMLGLPAIFDFLSQAKVQSNGLYDPPGFDLFHFYFTKVFPFITPTVYSIGMIVQTGSVYLTIAVTLERFVAVCLPFRSRSLCTYGRARYGVILVALFAIVYNLPRFWEIKWQTSYPYGPNIPITEVVTTELRRNHYYISIYYTWAYLIFMFFIPFACLAIFNLLIYRQVRIANSERSRMSRQEQKEIGLATMLMVVVIVFFLCNVLALVVNILEHLFHKTFPQMININNLLITLNSSVNFIIYCIFNDKFKRIFCKLFCCQMVLHKFGIYSNGGPGGAFTETYVHRYPDNAHRTSNTTATNLTTIHANNFRGTSPRPGTLKLENLNQRNSISFLNNNGNASNNLINDNIGMKSVKIYKETKTLLLNDGVVLSDEEEYCSIRQDNVHGSTSGFTRWKKNKKQFEDGRRSSSMKNNFFHRQVTNAGYTFNNASERYCIKDDESLGTADFLLSNSFSENQLKKKKKKSACKKLSLISKKRPFYNINNADGFEDSKLKRTSSLEASYNNQLSMSQPITSMNQYTHKEKSIEKQKELRTDHFNSAYHQPHANVSFKSSHQNLENGNTQYSLSLDKCETGNLSIHVKPDEFSHVNLLASDARNSVKPLNSILKKEHNVIKSNLEERQHHVPSGSTPSCDVNRSNLTNLSSTYECVKRNNQNCAVER